MPTRALSDEDRGRLAAERAEADRRYNDALTALDALVRAPAPVATRPVAPLDDRLVAAINDRWRVLPAPPEFSGGWRGRLSRFIWRIVGPIVDRQQAFNAAVVEHLNRNVEGDRGAREALNATVASLGEALGSAVRFQSSLIYYLQQITAYVDTKDREMAAGVLADPHEQIRGVERTLGLMQQQLAALTREFERQRQFGQRAGVGPRPK